MSRKIVILAENCPDDNSLEQARTVFLWRKLVDPIRVDVYQARLREEAGDRLAIIQRSQRKRILLEVSCDSQSEAGKFEKRFGGRTKKLPPDWLGQFDRNRKTKPVKVGDGELIIPASGAFGTGEHATTAMSLHLLEHAIKSWGAHAPSRALFGASPELLVDLGTGTGILALAARILGARRVVGIDHDPMAISIAKENARRNQIANVSFRLADVRRWKIPRPTQIVTANLFSELVIDLLPRLKRVPWVILSGILSEQEAQVVRALKRNRIWIAEIRRRGKWIAILGGQKTDLRA